MSPNRPTRQRSARLTLILTVLALCADLVAPASAATRAGGPEPEQPAVVEPLVIPPGMQRCSIAGQAEVVFDDEPGTVYYGDEQGGLFAHPVVYECYESIDVYQPTLTTTSAPIGMGTKTFTTASPTYTRTHAHTGTFNGQYVISSGSSYRVAFGFSIIPWLKAVATSPVSANVRRSPASGTCSYNKTGVSVYYAFHWSCTTPWQQTQTLNGTWTFRVLMGGRTGTATIRWWFQYRVGPAPCQPGKPC